MVDLISYIELIYCIVSYKLCFVSYKLRDIYTGNTSHGFQGVWLRRGVFFWGGASKISQMMLILITIKIKSLISLRKRKEMKIRPASLIPSCVQKILMWEIDARCNF